MTINKTISYAAGAILVPAIFAGPVDALAAELNNLSSGGEVSDASELAQTPVGLAAPTETNASRPTDQIGVEDIVVTAQKRSENLQTIPISITSVSEKTLEKLEITSTTDLSRITSGLTFSQRQGLFQPYIRGIGSDAPLTGDEALTAIYVDGVYVGTPRSGVFSFNNIERIEVLKGPQGTLFGRNAVAGVIQVITKSPSHDPSFDLKLGYGNYDTRTVNFYGTAGISSDIAADLAVYYEKQHDGFGTNLFTGNDVLKRRSFNVRSKWMYESDNTKITLAGSYSNSKTDDGTALRDFPGGNPLLFGFQHPGYYNVNTYFDPYVKARQWDAALTLDQDLGFANLVSITSYLKVKSLIEYDQTGTPVEFVRIFQRNSERVITQELRLVSPGDSDFQWLLGLYYFDMDSPYVPLLLTGGLFGPGGFSSTTSLQGTQSYAAFGQATYEILPKLKLTLGGRYTRDRRTLNGTVSNQNGITASVDTAKNYEKFTYRAALDYQLTDRVLLYASQNRGFKAGLFSTVTITLPPLEPAVLDASEVGIKTQLFDNRLRLNIAGFYYKFKNLQVQSYTAGVAILSNAASARSQGFDLDFELVADRNLSFTGALTYNDAIYTSYPGATRYVATTNAQGIPTGGAAATQFDASGQPLPNAPKWTGNIGAFYKRDTAIGELSGNVLYAYKSGFNWAQDGRARQPAFGIFNASVQWVSSDEHWSVRLWGKNLTDKKYHVTILEGGVGDKAAPAAPLTFGVTVGTRW